MLDAFHPNVLVLCSAILIAFARVLQRYAVARMSTHTVTLIMGGVAAAGGWAFYRLEGGLDHIPLTGVLWFIAVGFFGAGCGRYLFFTAIKMAGLARSTVISQTVMIWIALIGVIVLGERMTIPLAIGTLGILFGASLLVYREEAEIQQRIPLIYYLLPALSAFMYALAHVSGKFAFRWIPSPAFGMAVSNTTSFALILAMTPFARQSQPGQLEWKGLAAILVGGVIQGFGILLFWSAVKLGDLTRVIPLSRFSLVLIIFFSWLFFRQQESVTWRVVVGGLIALTGAVIVAGGK